MLKKTTGKWVLFVVAFIASCLIWYMVITNDDPRINVSLGNVKVELLNEKLFHKEGFAYYVEENAAVEVVVNVVQEKGWLLKPEDIRLTADLLSIKEAGEMRIPIHAEVTGHKLLIENNYKLKETSVKIKTEKLVKKEIPVRVSAEGEPEDDRSVGVCIPAQKTITIKTPKSLADQVVTAAATVDISGRSTDYEGEVQLVFYDENNLQVDCAAQQIFPETDKVSVRIPIGMTKEVDVNPPQGTGACKKGYRCTGITADKRSVTILGPESVLKLLDSITIPAQEIDLTDKEKSFEKSLNLGDYLPKGVIIYKPKEASLLVRASIEKLERKTVTLSASNISFQNVPPSLKASAKAYPISAVIEALPEELEKLEPDKIRMTVDLKGCKAGTRKADISFRFDVSDINTEYKVISSDKVTVVITES